MRWEVAGDRDWVLMTLLAVLNLGSLLTTTLGAQELLPEPMSYILGFSIQVMLFTLLAGFAGQHAPVRKWLAAAVFALACVYCSFFTYYGQLSGDLDAQRQAALAETRHAALVKAVYAEARNEGERLRRQAEELERQAREEAARGGTTGVAGYGKAAKEMQAKANAARLAAEQHLAVVDQVEPLFEYDLAGLTAKEVHTRDLAAWQRAPSEWTQTFPAPVYAEYVDEASQVQFLLPFLRVREGDPVAVVSLLLASSVDGIAILLGTAIDRRRRRWLVDVGGDSVATLIRDGHEAWAKIKAAWTLSDHTTPPTEGGEGEVALTVRGPAYEFLRTFRDGVHPANGHVDLEAFRHHPNPTYGAAASALLSHLGATDAARQIGGEWHISPSEREDIDRWLARAMERATRLDAKRPPERSAEPWTVRVPTRPRASGRRSGCRRPR